MKVEEIAVVVVMVMVAAVADAGREAEPQNNGHKITVPCLTCCYSSKSGEGVILKERPPTVISGPLWHVMQAQGHGTGSTEPDAGSTIHSGSDEPAAGVSSSPLLTPGEPGGRGQTATPKAARSPSE